MRRLENYMSKLEPILVTEPRLIPILEELKKREPIFHLAEYGTSRADFENMTDPAFWEVGASGRRYSREYVIDRLVERHSTPHIDICETRDFHCLEIAPDNYLLTYTLIERVMTARILRRFEHRERSIIKPAERRAGIMVLDAARVTRRATLWRRSAHTWKIVYHQGTVVEGD
jgi:hypothetical protein